MSATDGADPARPALRIVRGDPTPEELAALTAIVAAASAAAEPQPATAPVHGGWNDPARAVRGSWRPGPGAWAASPAVE